MVEGTTLDIFTPALARRLPMSASWISPYSWGRAQ